MIEVCREFQRGKCSREADECRYAHPPAHVLVENGHVTACFDSLKDQCTRESCKYLHPPKLVKEELQASSRAFSQTQTALQQLCNPLMFQQQALCTSQNMISPWGIMIPSVMPFSFQPTAVMIPEVPCSGGRRKDKSDKLEVCREYQRSQCPRGNDECKYAHPEAHIHPDPADNMVTVCMDYMKERCEREACRYFHPPPHLQARVKANQLNASSLMAAAAQSQALALTYPEMVKRQAMSASLGGAGGPNSLMAGPWNMSQQLALQGALAAGGIAGAGIGAMTGGQPLQLANSLALNPGALMHQQAAVPYATYAMPVSSAYGVIPGPFNSTQTVAQATTTPTQ